MYSLVTAYANNWSIIRYYYQYQVERLPACTLTIHRLLHIAEGIRYCRPIWTTWTFFMERCCGTLQRSMRSRAHPWRNLNQILLNSIILEQLAVQYDVAEELAWWDDKEDDGPIGYERIFEGCKHFLIIIVDETPGFIHERPQIMTMFSVHHSIRTLPMILYFSQKLLVTWAMLLGNEMLR